MRKRFLCGLICLCLLLGVVALSACQSAKDMLNKLNGESVTFLYREEPVTVIETVTDASGEAVTDDDGSVVTVVITVDPDEPAGETGTKPVKPSPGTTPATDPVNDPETEPETLLNDETRLFLRSAFQYFHKDNYLQIGGWATPASSLRDGNSGKEGSYDAAFQLLADAGLNYIITLEEQSAPTWGQESLSSARRAGLKLWYNCAGQGTDATLDGIRALLASDDAEALGAVFVKDKPTADDLDGVKSASDAIRDALGENKLPVLSGLPSSGASPSVSLTDYRAYLQKYVDTVKPDILMIDTYPYPDAAGDTLSAMAVNLAIAQEIADKAEIGLYTSIRASGQATTLREPSLEELRAAVNLQLAMGVKGFAYDLACAQDGDGANSAMIDANGQPTALYDRISTVNGELKGMNGVCVNYAFKGLLVLNDPTMSDALSDAGCKTVLEKYGPLKSTEVANDKKAVIGCFADYGNYAGFYVVNTDCTSDTEVTLHFDDCRLYGVWGTEGLDACGAARAVTVRLKPGEGTFVIVSG